MSLIEDYKRRVGHKRWHVDDPRPTHGDRRILEVELTDGRSQVEGDIALVMSHATEWGNETRLWITLSAEQAREVAQHLDRLIQQVEVQSSIEGAA